MFLLQGYVKRQAVFACNTCTPNDRDPAGICLACANTCHDGHDIFELYTKRYVVKIECYLWHEVFFSTLEFLPFFFLCLRRNFRCDCGNKRFGDFKCQLIPVRDVFPNWICLTHFSYHLIPLWHIRYFTLGITRLLLYLQAKDQENNKNLYNHNFWGCYCTCDRPYPDTDDQVYICIRPLGLDIIQIL